ncbi:MAG TPA: glycerophosphodiester phosphodiesterase family protein [Bacteroidales bacterium]|nr:glycerophosphodiester phosphodiesterase family protein [Bacteroidales bacterium]
MDKCFLSQGYKFISVSSICALLISALTFSSCDSKISQKDFDIQGHRGARGLFPENTIPSFIRAIENGATTLELDLALTADSLLVISHEPWLSSEICLDSLGNNLSNDVSERYNLYHMYYSYIQKFDCGSKRHPHFPSQEKIPAVKPLLSDLLDTLDQLSIRIPINVEIKSRIEWDGKYYPSIQFLVQQLLELLSTYQYQSLSIIQSFDTRPLQYLNTMDYPGKIALLISNDEDLFSKLNQLQFKPHILSPHHKMVDPELSSRIHENDIELIPWTVNDKRRMKELIEMGVDGIITDYPNRLKQVFDEYN